MGKNNRIRRAEKKRQRERSNRQAPDDSGGRSFRPPPSEGTKTASIDHEKLAHSAVIGAIHALDRGVASAFEAEVRRLVDLPVGPRGKRWGFVAVSSLLGTVVGAMWPTGWQPADVERYVRRSLGSDAAHIAVDAIAAEEASHPGRPSHPRWQAQLIALDARVWWDDQARTNVEQWADKAGVARIDALGTAIRVLHLLSHAPRLPVWMPYPGAPADVVARWARSIWVPDSIDRKMLERVRALLAKAESTTFPEEADALTAKAQQLMARHSIDSAFVSSMAGGRDVPGARRVGLDDPYAGAKAQLVHVVAGANRCRAIWNKQLGFSEVVGFEADLDIVELLCTSLLVQATAAIVAAGRRVDTRGTSRTRSFRQSFLVSYAARIGERLREAAQQTVREASAAHGDRLLPVMVGREQDVRSLVDEVYSGLRSVASSATNREGWIAGRVAADRAQLGPDGAHVLANGPAC